ncbi:unnamed protein product [Victoria cruziana]
MLHFFMFLCVCRFMPVMETSAHDVASSIFKAKNADISLATSSEETFTSSSSPPSSPSSPSSYEPPSGSEAAPYIGQVFPSDEVAYNFYKNFARSRGFAIRRQKVTRKRGSYEEFISSRYFLCHRAGSPVQKVDDNKVQRCRCGAGMGIKRLLSGDSRWVVIHFSNIHNHELIDQEKLSFLSAYRKITENDKNRIAILAKAGIGVRQILRCLELEHGVELGCLPFSEKDVRNFIQSIKVVINENGQDLLGQCSNAFLFSRENRSSSNQIDLQVQRLQLIASDIIMEFRKSSVDFELVRDELVKVRDLVKRLQSKSDSTSRVAANSLVLSGTDSYVNGISLISGFNPFQVVANGRLVGKNDEEGMKPAKKPRYCKVPSCGQTGHDSRNCPMRKVAQVELGVQNSVSSSSAKKPRYCKVPSCGQIGHDSRNCPMKKPPQLELCSQTSLRYCNSCGQSGHDSRNCPMKRAAIQLQIGSQAPVSLVHNPAQFSGDGTPLSEKSNGDSDSAKKPRYCKVPSCGQTGHDSRNCPMKRASESIFGLQPAISLMQNRIQTSIQGPSTDGILKVVSESLKKPRCCKVPNCGQTGHDSRNCPLKRVVESEILMQPLNKMD